MLERKIDRRRIVGALAVPVLVPVAASQAVGAQTPVASPVVEDQIALFDAAQEELRGIGREVAALVLSGDDAALLDRSAPQVRDVLAQVSLASLLNTYQTDRVHLALAEGRIHLDGHYDGSWTMTGFYGGVGGQFRLDAEAEQGGPVPAGRWNGVLVPGNLSIGVTFAGGKGDLTATLDGPGFDNEGQPLENVTFTPEQPIGDRVQERALPFNPNARLYSAAHAWGDAELVADISFDAAGAITGLVFSAYWPLPDDPMAGAPTEVPYRLPADGPMTVFWGGETVLQNYHAAYPSQRHALDLVEWRDGATFGGDGARNEAYFIWGRPVVAPVAGAVVAVENGLPDIAPGEISGGTGDAATGGTHPAGNHVVIAVGEEEYVYLAHMQQGSVGVTVGDTLAPGDPIGLVGNSGNTSEPHIHIHIQTAADFFDPAALGVPIAFANYLEDGEPVDRGMPVQGQFVENQ